MMPTRDIHDFNAKYEAVLKQLKKSTISDKNKDLVRDFDRACFLEGLSKPRRIRLIGSLVRLGENYLEKDFDKASEEDLKKALMQIESREDCSVWTKHGYKTTIKKFYKWLEYGDNYKERNDYPKIVSWIRAHIKKKDKPRVQASDILTEKEVKKLISASEHPRDKAFISMLYELGARIGACKCQGLFISMSTVIRDELHRRRRAIHRQEPHITARIAGHMSLLSPYFFC